MVETTKYEVILKPTIFPPYPQNMNYEPYDGYTTVNKMRTECYTYLNKPMWPKHKPLTDGKDYHKWAPKPKFYKK